MCVNGATDGRVFLTFLKEVLVPQLWPGAVVILDNLGAHKVKGVREQIEAAGAPALPAALLGGLQPHRTALEQAQNLPARRGRTHTSAALDRAIADGPAAISAQDARGYFAHRGYLGKPT